MATWSDVMKAAPDLARRAQERFDAHRHKALATLRKDGSPRISGIETVFAGGEVWLGMMPDSLKAKDLLRDPRMALHSATIYEGPTELHDAKLGGRAVHVTDENEIAVFVRALEDQMGQEGQKEQEGAGEGPPDFILFRVEVNEVVMTSVGDPPDHLLIEMWHEGEDGVRRIERK